MGRSTALAADALMQLRLVCVHVHCAVAHLNIEFYNSKKKLRIFHHFSSSTFSTVSIKLHLFYLNSMS